MVKIEDVEMRDVAALRCQEGGSSGSGHHAEASGPQAEQAGERVVEHLVERAEVDSEKPHSESGSEEQLEPRVEEVERQ